MQLIYFEQEPVHDSNNPNCWSVAAVVVDCDEVKNSETVIVTVASSVYYYPTTIQKNFTIAKGS